jgi:hypothetical protein
VEFAASRLVLLKSPQIYYRLLLLSFSTFVAHIDRAYLDKGCPLECIKIGLQNCISKRLYFMENTTGEMNPSQHRADPNLLHNIYWFRSKRRFQPLHLTRAFLLSISGLVATSPESQSAISTNETDSARLTIRSERACSAE